MQAAGRRWQPETSLQILGEHDGTHGRYMVEALTQAVTQVYGRNVVVTVPYVHRRSR
jgi:hypothetical protein